MIQLYDEALFDYLKENVSSEVAIVPVSDYWRVISMHRETKLSLPAVCISRSTSNPDREMKSWVIGRKGRTDRIQQNKRFTEQAIPMVLQYNLTALTTRQDDIDELTSELIFLILNKPKVTIQIPYGSNRLVNAQIDVNGDVSDASSRDTFSETGFLYQSIIPVRMVGAGIFNVEKRNLRYLRWSVDPNITPIKEEK